MPPKTKLKEAFSAMRDIGITEQQVKPVLKKLLKVYDKNWDLIAAENYRVLADAIFEEQDAQPTESMNVEAEDNDEVALSNDETEHLVKRALKRNNSSSMGNGTPLKQPKVEVNVKHTTSSQPETDAAFGLGHGRTEPHPVSPGPVSPLHCSRNKGKQSSATDKLPSPSKTANCDLVSNQMHAGQKRKEPFPPQLGLRDKKRGFGISSRTPHAEHPTSDPGILLLPKQKKPIIPKDEPFTDGMCNDQMPLAVIHPDSLSNSDTEVANLTKQKPNGQELPASRPVEMEGTNNPNPATSLPIASSRLGEVKISLSCTSAIGGPNFHMPSLDKLRELMEDRCLRSYKIIDPNFSLVKLMEDMCECFVELATNSSNESQEKIPDGSPNLESSNNSDVQDTLVVKDSQENTDMSYSVSNGLVVIHPSAFHVPRPLQVEIGLYDHVINGKANEVDQSNSLSLALVSQSELSPEILNALRDINDITRGKEYVAVSWINEITTECPPPFTYLQQNQFFNRASVNFTLSLLKDENCCPTCFDDCLALPEPCACAIRIGGEFAYNTLGLLKETFLEEAISMTLDPQKQCLQSCKVCPLEKSKEEFVEPCKGHLKRLFIKECWTKCGCNKQCGNRVVQRGLNRKLQVFFTPEGKGWGLRTLEKLPKGAFVCEYVGEVLTITELYERIPVKPTSPVLLDAVWATGRVSEDNNALCLDASHYGNIARYINHRCFDANLIEIPVEVDTPEHHYYHIAFFTTREIDAMEELTWDYGINFDESDYPAKTFRCSCESKFCRNMKRARKSKYPVNGS